MTYTLIGSLKTRALRVAWMLEELGLDYAHDPAGARSAAVVAHYPPGKVPVLLADAAVLTDSVAIMTFLADRHGAFTHPAGSIERALQDGHTQFLCDEIEAMLWTAARHSFVLPEEHRVPQVKDSLKWEFARSLERLETRLGDKPYLTGDAPTVPDFLAAHCAGWARYAKFPDPTPALGAYYQRMQDRPAFLKLTKAT